MGNHPGIYREGLGAALAVFQADKRRVIARGRAIGVRARRRLPPALWMSLKALERQALTQKPVTVDELVAAEALIEDYAREIDLGLSVLEELRPLERERTQRIPRVLVVLLAAILVVGEALATAMAVQAHLDRQHLPLFEAQCRSDPSCARSGNCTAVLGFFLKGGFECRATWDTDCQASQLCKTHGFCELRGGRCEFLRTDATCKSLPQCKEEGRCSANPHLPGNACEAVTVADCEQSRACLESGRCFPYGTWCRANDSARCRALPICRIEGRSMADGERCSPGSEDDCVQSDDCLLHGLCRWRRLACSAQ